MLFNKDLPLEENALLKQLHNAQENNNSEKEIEILLKLAQINYETSHFKRAEIYLRKVFQKDNFLPNIHYYEGLISVAQDKIPKAIQSLQKELKLYPNNHKAKELLQKLEIYNNFPLGVIFILLTNLIIFFLLKKDPVNLFKYSYSRLNHTLFALVSSTFYHYNFLHLFLNLFAILVFGLILEKKIGTWRFLLIYILSSIIGNMFQLIFSTNPNLLIIGASGGVFGIFGALIIKEPLLDIKIFGLIDVPIIYLLSFLLLISFSSFFVKFNNLYLGNFSHLIGLFVGIFLLTLFYPNESSTFYNWVFIIASILIIYLNVYILLETILSSLNTISKIKMSIMNIIMITFGSLTGTYLYFSLKERFTFKTKNEN